MCVGSHVYKDGLKQYRAGWPISISTNHRNEAITVIHFVAFTTKLYNFDLPDKLLAWSNHQLEAINMYLACE